MIQKEKIQQSSGRIEDRETMCRAVIRQAEQGKFEIATSTLSLAEVCKNPTIKQTDDDQVAAYFEHDYILLVNLDRHVGETARSMMRAYSLKPADAIHLATAIVSRAEELHSFDGDLLDLDDVVPKLDGTDLKICKPDVGGTVPPLIKKIQDAEKADDAKEDE
jgi:predicted nucleic acid-binding protein